MAGRIIEHTYGRIAAPAGCWRCYRPLTGHLVSPAWHHSKNVIRLSDSDQAGLHRGSATDSCSTAAARRSSTRSVTPFVMTLHIRLVGNNVCSLPPPLFPPPPPPLPNTPAAVIVRRARIPACIAHHNPSRTADRWGQPTDYEHGMRAHRIGGGPAINFMSAMRHAFVLDQACDRCVTDQAHPLSMQRVLWDQARIGVPLLPMSRHYLLPTVHLVPHIPQQHPPDC